MSRALKILEDGGLITIDGVASILNVHRRTVQRWIRSGKLTVVDRVQYVPFIDVEEVRKMMPHQPGKSQWGILGGSHSRYSLYDPFNIKEDDR